MSPELQPSAAAPPARLGLIEDDPVMGQSLQQRLELEGYRVAWWRSGAEALQALERVRPDVLVCDIRLPDMTGEEVFQALARAHRAPPTLFITAFGEIEQAVRLMRQGADDYLTKPFAIDDFLSRLLRLLEGQRREGGASLGSAPAMRRIERLLRRAADIDSTVLITGETGVGKEVAARFLHGLHRAARGPFMAVNCAAIPRDLLESELFGHERGAFTGAHQRHEGYLERAGDGTLFLDEIGELPLDLQAKLLRLLQDRSFLRVGGEKALLFRARLVAATNADLSTLMANGTFRQDLFYRINVIAVDVPPLRERHEDLPALAATLLALFRDSLGRPPLHLSPGAEDALLAHDWPGNVRELSNRIERAVALARGPVIAAADLFPELAGDEGPQRLGTLAEVRAAAERRQIRRALSLTEGHPGRAAELLEVSRTTLWEKMRRLGLQED